MEEILYEKRKEKLLLFGPKKRDGKLFCTYGNFKEAWNRPKYLFNLVSSAYIYAVKLPFGNLLASNVSSDLRYNSKDYSVIRQAAM